ncbi:MAG: ABC transporter ATP-binding protein/permease [Anaerolineales bacterium]|jgi:ATP-binding cassette subfamily B protein|nr:ABC transporter ATP-binding protein/permease [Anaerolineales bacterium]
MSVVEFREEEFSTEFNGQTVLRILGLTKPHWPWLIGFLVTIGVVSALDAYFTYLGKRIIDEGILAGDRAALFQIIRTYGWFTIVQVLNVFGFIYLAGVLGERVQYDLRKNTFNHLQNLSLSYFDRTPVGWIMSRVTSDSERIAQLVTWGLLDVTWGLLNIGTAVYFMVLINWQLALIVLMIIPILVVIAAQFKKKILLQFRLVRKINSKITGTYNEQIAGVRVIKALNCEVKSLNEFSELTSEMYNASYRAAWFSALFLPTVQFVSAIAIGTIAWYGGLQVPIAGITIGGIQAFISYITFMMWPIQDLARVYAEMQHAIASAERVFSLVDSTPEVQDKPDAFDPGSIQGDISFEAVDFFYEKDSPVLENFTLYVQRGETIALVGPTGGGKSTIVNLVSRFYEPRKGRITIGGQDYTDFSLHAIHSRIGMVLQTPHLFSGTVRDNLRYGRLNARDDEIQSAAEIAGAHNFINKLEKGYETEVGEGGIFLSVGQKQLISLARALLADPEIFIMDEATSSVDTLTEALIQQGMAALTKERTSFIIAHRLSTIKRADRILVIENGKILEMGAHAKLLEKKGRYFKLYTEQFRRQLEQEFDSFQQSK